jgi:hypothetical protein
MSANVRFKVPLDCLQCGAHNAAGDAKIYTSALNDTGVDRWVSPGDLLPIALADFEDAYFTLRLPADGEVIRALEQWTCAGCRQAQWAELTFADERPAGYRFLGARAVPLTPPVVAEMHFISDKVDYWLKANPGPTTDRLIEMIGYRLP